MAKQRTDQLLVERGFTDTRTKAQALIMAGLVFSADKRIIKSGEQIAEDAPLDVRGQEYPWVSRGGCKLAHALEYFNLSPQNKVCLDIGASTGGFTDVLLTRGARSIYAVDVGHGQLAWKLRSHPHVIVLEKCNARFLNRTLIPTPLEAVVCDASFISLKTVIPAALDLTTENAWAIALIKPQFEAGKTEVGHKGIIRDPAVHQRVCDAIATWWHSLPGWHILGITTSPITGHKGNREFLIAAQRQ
ncbi:MAG: TlyA family RNA methyltransferase [Acetobacter sp.]|nr:TlyA family RNA methyltransferase [Acetobacter sp.]